MRPFTGRLSAIRASDEVVSRWAREHGYVVFTHDLDFGAALAMSHAIGPSVVQLRSADVLPETLSPRLVPLLERFERELIDGALVLVDVASARVRVLPI